MPNNFGIIGTIPDQRSANSGVYDLTEINELQSVSEWSNKNALTLLETIDYSDNASPSQSFTNLMETTYRVHLITITKLIPANDNVSVRLQAFLSGSGSLTNTSDYTYHQLRGDDAGTINNGNSTGDTRINIGINQGNGGRETLSSNIWIFNAGDSTQRTAVLVDTVMEDDQGDLKFIRGVGSIDLVDDVTGLRIDVTSGNLERLKANLYGVQ